MAIIEAIPSREEQLRLEPEIAQPVREALRHGATLFDSGRFWDAHEVWEEIWQEEERSIRSFYQGLIQLAAGYHHWTVTHRPRGVQTLLAMGATKLSWYRPAYLDVDVEALIADAARMQTLARSQDAAWLAAYPRADLPSFPWLQPDA